MSIVDLVTIQKLSPAVKTRARRDEIVYLFDDTKPGWKGSAPFYVFACINEGCVNHERLTIDYAHGFKNHNERVTCPECGINNYFPVEQPTFRQIINMFLGYRKWLKKFKKQRLLTDARK